MKHLYSFAVFSITCFFATVAIADVTERKSCDEITAEIAKLSAITEPDEETIDSLTKLKQQQRRLCQKRAGARGTASQTASRASTATTKSDSDETPSEPKEQTCETPDDNGCCPGEIYTDMGDLGFNCCPESGGDCFPPIVVSVDTSAPESVSEPEPELTSAEKTKNLESGLCADGTKPNKFGCCGDEIFKDMGNTVFACCPKSGGDCFPPIQ